MNQLGNKKTNNKDRKQTFIPYFDYTEYSPRNTAYQLVDTDHWQPDITYNFGISKIQKFVTPQYRYVKPYSYENPERFRA